MQTETPETKINLSEVDGETATFSKTDKKGQKFTFTVKNKWLKENTDYESLKILDIVSQRNIYDYLHSTKGPALVDKSNHIEAFFLNGRYLDPSNDADKETIERIKHNTQFNAKMEEILA